MSYLSRDPCKTCGSFEKRPRGSCAACHRQAAARYRARKMAAEGHHSAAEWQAKAAKYDTCPICKRPWHVVDQPNGQRLPYTKGHIIALADGGSDGIDNIQPECAKCNYARHGAHLHRKVS
jgi:hypothetical protein